MTLPQEEARSPKCISRNTLQEWEILTYRRTLFYCELYLDHYCCFMTLPPEAAYSPKTAELRDIKYSDVYYEARLL
jgi:hypothetical protein